MLSALGMLVWNVYARKGNEIRREFSDHGNKIS